MRLLCWFSRCFSAVGSVAEPDEMGGNLGGGGDRLGDGFIAGAPQAVAPRTSMPFVLVGFQMIRIHSRWSLCRAIQKLSVFTHANVNSRFCQK